MPQSIVLAEEVFGYVLSLIKAVHLLHGIGMLHCDIKPANISWDAKRRQVALVDFGHSQLLNGALNYGATRGYETPEVLMKQPHSPATDAYSVGATLSQILKRATRGHGEYFCCEGDDDEQLGAVKCVVLGLTRESPTARMRLEEADRKLKP